MIGHLTAGTAAGLSALIVGHPFDTIKVKIQASTGKVDALKLTAQLVKKEGMVGLYRGMGSLVATVAACNAVLFASRGTANKVLSDRRGGGPLTLSDQMISSTFAGGCCALIASPAELIKCRLQGQGSFELAQARYNAWKAAGAVGQAPTVYRGPFDVVKDLVKTRGPVRGMALGLGACLIRDTIGCGALFVMYESIKTQLATAQNLKSTKELGMPSLMLSGGLGGIAFWTFVYPMDVIKSRIQMQSLAPLEYEGILDCGRKVVAKEGVKGLFRGLGACLARSFPANAVAFVVYEEVMAFILRSQP